MGDGSGMQSTAMEERAAAPTSRDDRWLRLAGMLLAWAGVACAVAGVFHRTPDVSRGAIALAVTLCACAVLVVWALAPTSPPVPLSPRERGWRAAPGVRSVEPQFPLPLTAESTLPTVTIARPAGDWQPLAAPPRPLYELDDLAAGEAIVAAQSPFLADPLFRLEDPGPGAWLARVSKDPTQLCQDSFACDPTRGVYAVTDGVSRSFMPAAWARIAAQAAIAHPDPFGDEVEFAAWLDAAADLWRGWMHEVWLPQARASTGHSARASTGRPYGSGDWGDEIDGQGAQTTLVCCSIGEQTQRRGPKTVRVDVTAIGDAECLLFRQGAERWKLVAAFPLEHPSDFGATPATLATRRDPEHVAAMYRSLRRGSFEARPGDRLALATDAVACWLLALARNSSSPRPDVVARPASSPAGEDLSPSPPPRPPRASADSAFTVTPSSEAAEDPIARALEGPDAFERLAQVEIDAGRLEDDDLTLLVIAIT
ncbi:MAG TPA: hypothetical protein VF116_12165 [Ktedonobacterales bacterium]